MTRDDRERATAVGGRVRVRVPSKINLFLAVRGRRADGYHELVSILQTIGIFDELVLGFEGTPWACLHPSARRFMQVRLEHDGSAGVPSGADNLVVRAADLLLERIGAVGADDGSAPGDVPLTRISLTKRIPVAAGMAGGSADAAAALVGLNQLWECGLDRDELRELAAELGADVPFCVSGGTALATGTGTATAQVLARGRFHWVVGMSDTPLSTPEVYRVWDDIGRPTEQEPDVVLQALRTDDAEVLGAALHNDLEVAAQHLRPELAEARDAMVDAGALGAVLSGSGPTVLGLAEDAAEARRIAEEVRGHFDRVEVAASPVGGPEVARG